MASDYWIPVLEGEYAARARNILHEISDKIETRLTMEQNPNLITGMAGQMLFLHEFAGDKINLESSVERLVEMVAGNVRMDCSLMHGLSGIGYVLKLINETTTVLDNETIDRLYHYTRRLTEKSLIERNFDYLHGYLGACLFLLEEDDNNENIELFKKVVNVLRHQAIPLKKGIGWLSLYELRVQFAGIEREQLQTFNLGLSHGLPAIVQILYCLHTRFSELNISLLADEVLNTLMNEESEQNKQDCGYYYRLYGGERISNYSGQLSWCYSDLGIAITYFNLWQMTGRSGLWQRASRIAASCAEKKMEDTPGMGSGICHGAAGIAHIFNRMFQITKNDVYRQASCYWYSVLFDTFIRWSEEEGGIYAMDYDRKTGKRKVSNDYGLLEGLSGIGLTLHSAISCIPPVWDKILLLQPIEKKSVCTYPAKLIQ